MPSVSETSRSALWLRHWPEYAMEAALLGIFMLSACLFATLLFYQGSPVPHLIPDPFLRRVLMGIAMGSTASMSSVLTPSRFASSRDTNRAAWALSRPCRPHDLLDSRLWV